MWALRTRRLELDRPQVMAIVNVTTDSFSDGGRYLDRAAAVDHGRWLMSEGADIVDVGGESTRPGADPVDQDEEMGRVIPVVKALAAAGAVVSIDTMKPGVAAAAIEAGAEIVNDVGGLADPAMRAVCAATGAGVVIMHMLGTPRTMQIDPTYDDVVAEVTETLLARAALAEGEGVGADHICLDPGIGFGKTADHNLELLAHLDRLAGRGYPVMVGTSRKAFLGALLDIDDPAERDLATAVTVALAVERGASVVRVHQPRLARQAVALGRAIVAAEGR